MTDPKDRVEAELANMLPRPMPAELSEGLEAILSAPYPGSPWPDRCLAAAMCAGAIAACVILGVILNDATDVTPAPAPSAQLANVPMLGSAWQSLAQADAGWSDVLK